MGVRKAASYSKRRFVPYTRKSKKKNLSYIKTIPHKVLVKYNMGSERLYREKKLPVVIRVVSLDLVQIRDMSLEACRQFLNKQFETVLGKQFFFQVIPHPHHIQREHKMLTGAGADRMSTGMSLSFGATMNLAAIVKKNHPIFLVAVADRKAESFARLQIKTIKAKLPCNTVILTEFLKKV